MAKEFTCSYCQGTEGTRINTYKHYWVVCHSCENALHTQKDQYLLPMLFPGPLSYLVPKKIKKLFYLAADVKDNQSIAYEYYAGLSGNQTAVGTKWEGQFDKLRTELEGFDIGLKGKKVLDISGGPGFRAKEMEGVVESTVVTEYSQVSVDGMAKNLGIDVVKYDYNNDELDQVVDGKFDLILAINSINYCADIAAFAQSLRKVMHKDSRIYLNYNVQTLGCMLRSQLQEYNYNILFTYKSVKESFEAAGIEIDKEIRFDTGFYGWNYSSRYSGFSIPGMVLNFLRFSSSVPYLIGSMFNSKVNSALEVQVHVLVLKLKSED
jgi:hypothetical protein